MEQSIIDRLCEEGSRRLREKLTTLKIDPVHLDKLLGDIVQPKGEFAFRMEEALKRAAGISIRP